MLAKAEASKAPSQWAYDQACAALHKHKDRADALAQELADVKAGIPARDAEIASLNSMMESNGAGFFPVPRADLLMALDDLLQSGREYSAGLLKKVITAAPVASQAQPERCNNGCRCLAQCGDVYAHEGKPQPEQQPVSGADLHLDEVMESAKWRNALVGLCSTDRINTPEEAIANIKSRIPSLGKTSRPTPLQELVSKFLVELDNALRLDKSPTAWVHKPAGTQQERIAAWEKVHATRREIEGFLP